MEPIWRSIWRPLVIPHLLSSATVGISLVYEGPRDNSSGPFTSFVPTAAEMNGDFTGDPPIYNPYTTVTDSTGQSVRQQFPGNIIPSLSTTLCAPQAACINSAAETIYRGLILWRISRRISFLELTTWVTRFHETLTTIAAALGSIISLAQRITFSVGIVMLETHGPQLAFLTFHHLHMRATPI